MWNPFKGQAASIAAAAPIDVLKAAKSVELGIAGAKISSGYVFEEFLPELQGDRGKKIYREMYDNDPTVYAMITACDSVLRAVPWHVRASENDTTGEGADLLESCMDDMEQPWAEFISDILSFLPFGFSYFEKVFKRRIGPNEKNPERKSQFSDGLIGIRKIAMRAQETIDRWEVAESGEILGAYQQPPYGGHVIFLPIEKCLLFRTTTKKNNPEGRSALRSAYKPYFFKKTIEVIESMGVERELAGMPVLYVPAEVLTEEKNAAVLNAYIQMVRDVKFNDQGGVILPSDPWRDDQGKPTSIAKVRFELLSSSGSRNMDTGAIIERHDRSITRTVLADFLMLGASNKGSFALSDSKLEFFMYCMQGYLDSIAGVLNRNLVPDLWKANGLPPETMPKFVPGKVRPVDLEKLGNYIRNMSQAGLVFAGDEETEKVLRSAADLPEAVSSDLMITPMGDPSMDAKTNNQLEDEIDDPVED